MTQETHVVTGAFGYSGKYITRRLLDAGHQVRTLTNSPNRPDSFGDRVQASPFYFNDFSRLVESLEGAVVLYNTYWVRFSRAGFSQTEAVENSLKLFLAAKKAGIQRVVHTSITNPSENSAFEYFRGKAKLEQNLQESGLSYAILRPAVLFGAEDILINNIAWLLRRCPIFGVFGDGHYKLQPIYVDDFAELAVNEGLSRVNTIINAVGPETFTYRELVMAIGSAIGFQRPIISIPPVLGYLVGSLAGLLLNDVVITRDEIDGLTANLLYVDSPAVGTTKLTTWAKNNAENLGRCYANELKRRQNRVGRY